MHNCIWGAKVQYFYETDKFFITFIALKLVFSYFLFLSTGHFE